jgi:hypothetical protein
MCALCNPSITPGCSLDPRLQETPYREPGSARRVSQPGGLGDHGSLEIASTTGYSSLITSHTHCPEQGSPDLQNLDCLKKNSRSIIRPMRSRSP